MQFRLSLDRDQVNRCRKMAREIATHLHKYIDRHTSVAIERAVLRAMGVHGQQGGQPLTEIVVEKMGKEVLRDGAGYWLGRVMWEKKCDAQAAAHHLVRSGLPTERPRNIPHGEIRRIAREATRAYIARMEVARGERERGGDHRWGGRVVAVVATADLGRDCDAIRVLAKEGIDGIVLRPPVKPDSATSHIKTGGWRGRKYDLFDAITRGSSAAHEAAKRRKGDLQFIWGGIHLLAPEVTVVGATEWVHAIEYDCLTATRIGHIHFKRALVDQQFVFRWAARAGLGLHVASDRWRELIDAHHDGPLFLVGMMLVEAMGEAAGVSLESMSPRHTLGTPSDRADRLVIELAQAQLTRELFPQVAIGFATLLARDTPDDCAVAGSLARLCDFAYQLVDGGGSDKKSLAAFQAALLKPRQLGAWIGEISDDIGFLPNGKIIRRTHTLLERMVKEFTHLHRRDFFKLVEQETTGLFNLTDQGAGVDGVIQKGKYYWNPLDDAGTKASDVKTYGRHWDHPQSTLEQQSA